MRYLSTCDGENSRRRLGDGSSSSQILELTLADAFAHSCCGDSGLSERSWIANSSSPSIGPSGVRSSVVGFKTKALHDKCVRLRSSRSGLFLCQSLQPFSSVSSAVECSCSARSTRLYPFCPEQAPENAGCPVLHRNRIPQLDNLRFCKFRFQLVENGIADLACSH